MISRRDLLRTTGGLAASLSLAPLLEAATLSWASLRQDSSGQRFAEGVVFHDRDGSGRRSAGDPPVAGVAVSNGLDVVLTDRQGRYRLPVTDDTILFVIKPSGWRVPVGPNQLPAFYYIHKPKGSPPTRYPGVSPTGELPPSVDFALQRQGEPDQFNIILFGDPQPRNQREVDFIANDVVAQVINDARRVDAKFGFSLGDEMFDVLSLFDSLNQVVAQVGIPWYNVVGNHDLNFDAPDDSLSTETFQRHFGPRYHAFNYGPVHFIVLDDVIWQGNAEPKYYGGLDARQLEFIRNDLKHVPKDRLVVLAMHIPLVNLQNREELYRLIEDRPNTFSFSAHTHLQQHHFIDASDGWRGKTPHHHLNHATVCGSWWRGAPDERGIPHATMSDGGPNGYSIVHFNRNQYKVTFRAASRPAEDQMRIWLPNQIRLGEPMPELIVNVYAGSTRSVTECRIDDGPWMAMTNFTGPDPYFAQLKALETGPTPPPGMRLPDPRSTNHMWKFTLPDRLAVGGHRLEVRTKDMFGQVATAQRIFQVSPPASPSA